MSKTSETTDTTTALSVVAEDVVNALPLGVMVLDPSLRILHRNRAAGRILIAGESVVEILSTPGEDAPDWARELRSVLDSAKPRRYESVAYRSAQGQTLSLNVAVSPLRPAQTGEKVGLVVVVEDVTGRARLRKRVRTSERMAAVGRLAARVAHELNNPLDGSLRYINLCARVLEESDEPKALEYLDHARKGLMRMTRIVSDLLEFSRSSPGQSEDDHVNRVVEEAIRAMSDPAERHDVVVVASYHDDDMPRVDSGKLFQVCCNVIKNAVDAMPDGGCLSVATALVDEHIVIRFEDTGTGLPDDIDRIFEPFYTTKPAGQGTGLGLAICKDYVEQLGGTITAGPNRDNGATITIRIPANRCRTS